jgi:hypothetical protein
LLIGAFGQEIDKETLPAILEHRKKHVAFLYMQNEIRLENARRARIMAEQSNNYQNVGGVNGNISPAGESYDNQGFGGIEGIAGAMEDPQSLVPNRQGSETGFLDQTLPIKEEYLRYLTNQN